MPRSVQTIELFSGKASFSKRAALFGYATFTIDWNSKFNPDLCIDILNLESGMLPKNPFIIWASIDCTAFSIASGNKYFDTVPYKYRKYTLIPKCEFARKAIKLVEKTIDLLFELNPVFFYVENPRGLLNHLPAMKKLPIKSTVYYADYGFNYMKPTDIWHNNIKWIPKTPKHKYSYKGLGNVCDSNSKANRSLIPPGLIDEILFYSKL